MAFQSEAKNSSKILDTKGLKPFLTHRIWQFLHALTMLFLLLNLYFWSKFSNKNDMVSAWRNFKNIFPRPLFIIIFRPEMLKFHPCSILTGDTRVEFVIFCVLRCCDTYYLSHFIWDEILRKKISLDLLVKFLLSLIFSLICRIF